MSGPPPLATCAFVASGTDRAVSLIRGTTSMATTTAIEHQETMKPMRRLRRTLRLATTGALALMAGCATATSPMTNGGARFLKEAAPEPVDWSGPTETAQRYRWTRYRWGFDHGVPAQGIILKGELQGGELGCRVKGAVPVVAGQFFFDFPGSKDIHIEIDEAVGQTTYAGLTFFVPCVLEIMSDGTLLADKADLVARDDGRQLWQSREVTLEDRGLFAFFPRPAAAN